MLKALLLPMAMFLVAALFYLYEFLLRVAPSSMFTDLMQDYGISASSLGLLSSIYFVSYAFLQLPVGAMTDKFGPRRLLTLAIILCASSTMLFANTQSYFWVCVARFFIGAGSAFAFISCMKVVTIWFKPQWFPLLTGLTLTIGMLGAVAGEVPVSLALHFWHWRTLMYVLGAVGLVLAVLAWLLIKDHNEQNPQTDYHDMSFKDTVRTVLKRRETWLVAMYGFLITGPTDAFGGMWGVPYLVQAHGFTREAAATAASMTFIGMAFGSPFLGFLTNRLHNRRFPMFLGSCGALVCLSLLVYGPQLTPVMAAALFFAYGFGSSYVLAFVVVRDLMQPKLIGTAVGFVNMASMLGSSIMMYVVGVILDSAWNGELLDGLPYYDLSAYQLGLLCLPVCYIMSAFIVIPMIKESAPTR